LPPYNVVAGFASSLALTRIVQGKLFGMMPHDPPMLGLAIAALGLIVFAAGHIPALRASRRDPMAALRYE